MQQAEVGQHIPADQHLVPLAPQRQRARGVPRDLQHLEPRHDVAFPQDTSDRVGSDRQQGALEPVAPRSAESIDPARADLGEGSGEGRMGLPTVTQKERTIQVAAGTAANTPEREPLEDSSRPLACAGVAA